MPKYFHIQWSESVCKHVCTYKFICVHLWSSELKFKNIIRSRLVHVYSFIRSTFSTYLHFFIYSKFPLFLAQRRLLCWLYFWHSVYGAKTGKLPLRSRVARVMAVGLREAAQAELLLAMLTTMLAGMRCADAWVRWGGEWTEGEGDRLYEYVDV